MTDKVKNQDNVGKVVSLAAWREAAAAKTSGKKQDVKPGTALVSVMSEEEKIARKELDRHRYYRDYLDEYGHEAMIANIEAIYGAFLKRPVDPNAVCANAVPVVKPDAKAIANSLRGLHLYYSKTHGPETAEFAVQKSCEGQGGGDLTSDVLDHLPKLPPHKPECG